MQRKTGIFLVVGSYVVGVVVVVIGVVGAIVVVDVIVVVGVIVGVVVVDHAAGPVFLLEQNAVSSVS